jgi:UDP-GlcNAc:undecaprenyl-phosphate GlcNAc-1-phosphate transferase
MISFLAIFLVALIASLILTPVARRISIKYGIVAIPGGRRQHKEPIPILGGLSVTIAYLVGIVLLYWLIPPSGDDAIRLRGVVLGSLVFFFGGLADDWWELSPWIQFAIQFAGAAIAISHIVFIEVFTNPVTNNQVIISWWPLVVIVTILWIVGIINIVNWMDGLDGLAAGVGTIAALLFAWHSYRLGQEAVAAFPLALAGALIGFLPYNFVPASIFLGSAGAYVLGYNLATLSILSPAKIATALLVLAIPILDAVWQIVDRVRHRQSPFYGDRGHLHFRLLDEGIPSRWIVLGYYGLSLLAGLVAIFAPGLTKLVILVLFAVTLLAVLIWISSRKSGHSQR